MAEKNLKTRDPLLWSTLVFLLPIPFYFLWARRTRFDLQELTGLKIPPAWLALIPIFGLFYLYFWWYKQAYALAVASGHQVSVNKIYILWAVCSPLLLTIIPCYLTQHYLNQAIRGPAPVEATNPSWQLTIITATLGLIPLVVVAWLALSALGPIWRDAQRRSEIKMIKLAIKDIRSPTNFSDLNLNLDHYSTKDINPDSLEAIESQGQILDAAKLSSEIDFSKELEPGQMVILINASCQSWQEYKIDYDRVAILSPPESGLIPIFCHS